MKENIETKDVQRTEYLDKNGLDMLWAKVKENTQNQVEVEYNRAQAVEGDITNKLDNLKYIPYVSKTNMNSTELGDFVKYQLGATEFIISAQHGSNDARTEFRFGEVNFISRSKDSAVSIDCEGVTAGLDNNIKLTNTGIRKYINRSTPAGSATEAFSTDGGVIDTTAFALKSELDSYAKKTDIPAIDTSDFISKTTTDAQIINSPLYICNVVIADNMEDENTDYVTLEPTGLQFSENNYTSSIELNGKDTDRNAECSIQINASHGNSLIRLYSGITGNENDESVLEITNSGISISNSQNENIGPDKVFATNGSVADLAQYVKKSEITTGGNVDDVQVNGISVVENKIANINSATKESLGVVKVGDGLNVTDGVISVSAGNYLTYDSVVNENYYISSHKAFTFIGDDQDPALSIGNNRIIVSNNNTHTYSKMLDNYIQLRADKNALDISCANITGNEYKGDDPTPYQQFVLNKKGVWLYGGDDNHVLTSNASTIDITQYVLKSVYDEKIAALEARIAALEAKHTETA